MIETVGGKIGRVSGAIAGIWAVLWKVAENLPKEAENFAKLIGDSMSSGEITTTAIVGLLLTLTGVLIVGVLYILIKDGINLIIEILKLALNNKQLNAAILAYKEAELEKLKAERNKVTTVNFVKEPS